MAVAVDSTFPLYPIASIPAAGMLLLVLLTSFIRQSWNFGLALLCFWLLSENLTGGINAIIWADNFDIRLYIYCDIVTHLQVFASIVKPVATLIITRRLYLIAGQRSVEQSNGITQRRNTAIEWTLGLVVPVVLAGPGYYVVQMARFVVLEGIGCTNAPDGSVLNILLLWSCYVVPPLVSVTVYYPRLAKLFYQQSRSINRFLNDNTAVSRMQYIRILAFASFDLLLTLPFGITSLVLSITNLSSQGKLVSYPGRASDHAKRGPFSIPYADIAVGGASAIARQYFNQWTSPVLAFALFILFGITAKARASYWRAIRAIRLWFPGWKLPLREHEARSIPGDIQSRVPPLDTLVEYELRSRPCDTSFEASEKEGKSTTRAQLSANPSDPEHAADTISFGPGEGSRRGGT